MRFKNESMGHGWSSEPLKIVTRGFGRFMAFQRYFKKFQEVSEGLKERVQEVLRVFREV